MSEMVERVAKAQWDLDRASGGRPAWGDADHEHRSAAMELARAAIEAMREPTEGMIDAGADADAPEWGGIGLMAALTAWCLMIDEALK